MARQGVQLLTRSVPGSSVLVTFFFCQKESHLLEALTIKPEEQNEIKGQGQSQSPKPNQ
jgi:hypothetical protein